MEAAHAASAIFMSIKKIKPMLEHKENQKRWEKRKMAKYGATKFYTFKDRTGKETEFKFQHVGLAGADDMLDNVRTETGFSQKKLREQLFEHVIFTADGKAVDYSFFEEQDFGGEMLAKVTKEAQDFIFPKI